MLSSIAAKYPLATTACAATIRGLFGDLAAQMVERKANNEKSDFDWRRLFLYASFTNIVAFLYDRPVYTMALPRYFPTIVRGVRSWSNVFKATMVDNLIFSPFVYFPMFYILKDCIIERTQSSPFGALAHCAAELPSQMLACWAFWMPITGITQAFVPVHLRIPFLSFSACGWVAVLSTRTSALDAGQSA